MNSSFKNNRIFFPGNPYPNGHLIKKFEWSARLRKKKGLMFDFHLVSDKYYAEEDESKLSDDDYLGETDWDSRVLWCNYHKCTMSSTDWGSRGTKAATKEKKLDLLRLENHPITADSLPLKKNFDYDKFAMHVYLLGHDSCANHEITFLKTEEPLVYDIEWKGKLALTYSGDEEFKYDFYAQMSNVKFGGIKPVDGKSKKKNIELLEAYLENSDELDLAQLLGY